MKKKKKSASRTQFKRQYRMVKRTGGERPPFPSPSFILAVVVLIAVGYGFYRFANYMIHESRMFQLKQLQVVGNQHVDKDEIVQLANVELGVQLFQIEPDSVSRHVMQNLYLEGVSVSRSLPSTLYISVQERKPVAYLVDGNVYMVDQTGKMLLRKPTMSVNQLPLITGLSVQHLLQNREPLLDALKLIGKMQEVDDELFQFVSEIHIEKEQPPCLYLIRGGARVDLGLNEQYQRIYLLSEFIKNTEIINQLDQIKKIDLTFADRIVVTSKS